jgi:hypothetical protein
VLLTAEVTFRARIRLSGDIVSFEWLQAVPRKKLEK